MRKIAAALTVAVVLVVGLLFLLPALVSTDWVRAELGRQLSSATGMTIRLDGPVRLSLLPRLAVVADDISLSTGAGDVAISAPRFDTSVTLSSLWSKKLEIQSVALADPTIALKASASAEPAPEPKDVEADPFAAIVDTLERLAINRLTITNGTLTSAASTGNAAKVTAIDADLRVPDLDREVSFSLAGTSNGRRVAISGSLSALRPILKRLPAQIAIEARLDPAPVAKFSALKASGEIQLNGNGSYQIKGGKFEIGDQSFQMDALFQPGPRHRFFADLAAKRVDIDALSDLGKGGSSVSKTAAGSGEPDLAMLAAFDADISVTIDELLSDKIRASDVQLAATLRDGHLKAKLEHFGLDAGNLTANASTNVAETPPTIRGNIASSGLDIGSIAKLAGQAVPLSGKLTADMGFAFRGLAAQRIHSSLNLQGTVGIREGKLPLAALADAQDRTANDITGLTLDAKLRDIGKPVDVTGKLAWRGQAVAFKSQVAPASFLAGGSVADASGPISLSVSSKYLEGSISGTVGGGGTFKGQVSATSPSVDRLMQWLGQGASRSLQDFAFKGDVDAGPTQFSFQKATATLNGVKASGQGSVKLGEPLTIRTSLNFARLDLAAFAGGGAMAGGKQKPGAATDAPVDLSFLKGLDAKVDIQADKLGYGKVFAGPVATSLTVADGKAHLNVPQSPFYGGTIAAEMTADGSGDAASLDLNTAITGAAAAPLLRDAADFDRIEGTLEATVAVSGAGKTTKSLARSLGGKAAAKFSDGAFRGIDIAEVYNNLAGLLAGGFKQDQAKKTTFTELGASFAIADGIAQTTDISLLGPLLRMDGSGTIDLADQTLDMRLNPRVVASLAGQGGDVAVKGIGVPVVVQGPLSAPRAYPDLSALAKDPQGALDMLSRLGLPTGKLNLDKLIPGQTGSNGDGSGKGAADLIGDLLRNAAPRPKTPPAAPEPPVTPNNGNAENAPPPSGSDTSGETEAEIAAPAAESAPVDPQARPQPAPATPEAPKKGEIDTLLDQLAN
ncbi:MAG: AsmA family protein [Mesorhizobium sp.]|uniref:AsmA family protein n=1 Tax=Mesorhizobium sp. TaxID=1871066 RepID=UPI000FE90E02|nr:AsmA family protein [Mesorhizobium sp.]RWB72015.1 MAG: AsmA family protein [Mesorhizobium sp.]